MMRCGCPAGSVSRETSRRWRRSGTPLPPVPPRLPRPFSERVHGPNTADCSATTAWLGIPTPSRTVSFHNVDSSRRTHETRGYPHRHVRPDACDSQNRTNPELGDSDNRRANRPLQAPGILPQSVNQNGNQASAVTEREQSQSIIISCAAGLRAD